MKTSLENVFYREPKHKLRNKNISYLPLVTHNKTNKAYTRPDFSGCLELQAFLPNFSVKEQNKKL